VLVVVVALVVAAVSSPASSELQPVTVVRAASAVAAQSVRTGRGVTEEYLSRETVDARYLGQPNSVSGVRCHGASHTRHMFGTRLFRVLPHVGRCPGSVE